MKKRNTTEKNRWCNKLLLLYLRRYYPNQVKGYNLSRFISTPGNILMLVEL